MPAISSLPAAASVNTTDILPIVQSGTTYKVTFSLLPISTAVQTALDAKVSIGSTVYVPQTGTTGAATVPSGVTADRPAAATGMIRYNTSITQFEGYNGSAWGTIGGGAKGGGADQIFFEGDATMTTDYTVTTGKNAVVAGPLTINSGVTLTIPSGSVVTIV